MIRLCDRPRCLQQWLQDWTEQGGHLETFLLAVGLPVAAFKNPGLTDAARRDLIYQGTLSKADYAAYQVTGKIPAGKDPFAAARARVQAYQEWARAKNLEAKFTEKQFEQFIRETGTLPAGRPTSKYELGAKLGNGGNKDVFAVKGDESKAVGILKKGTSLAAIVDEVALIEKLGAQGLPTVKIHEVVEVEGRPAIVMDRYAQGSKDVVRLQNNKVRIVGDSTFLNEKSVADLQKIRDIMVKNNVKIDDLQFLIKSDGSVVIADPLNVVVGQGPSNVNLRTIELLISVAQKKR